MYMEPPAALETAGDWPGRLYLGDWVTWYLGEAIAELTLPAVGEY
jgi:hypothetical protein